MRIVEEWRLAGPRNAVYGPMSLLSERLHITKEINACGIISTWGVRTYFGPWNVSLWTPRPRVVQGG